MTSPFPPSPNYLPNPVRRSGSATPPPGRTPLRIGEIVAWAVIVVSVAFIIGFPMVARHWAVGAPAITGENEPGVSTLLSSRYLVGFNHVAPLKSMGQDKAAFESLETSAKNPFDKFRVAIVRGEIQGREAGEAEMDRLAAGDPKVAADVETLKKMRSGVLPLDSPEWKAFELRHGWFADLAASEGGSGGDPLRERTIAAATRTFVTLITGVVLVLGFAFLGLILLITALVFFVSGRMTPAFNRSPVLPLERGVYVQGFAFYLGIMATAGLMMRLILWALGVKAGLWAEFPLLIAFGMGLLWPMIRGRSWSEIRAVLGLHAGKGLVKEMMFGAFGYIAGLPIIAVGMGVTLVLTKVSGLDASHPIVREMGSGGWSVAVIFLLASVYAPLTEELMFRGAFFGHLRQRFGFWVSAVSVSLIFAAIHPQGWPAIPALGSIAFVLAMLREYRGSIISSMTAHAINNTCALVLFSFMVS